MTRPIALQVKDLAYTIDHHAVLNGLNLQFEEGRIHGILGQNGAGKTTLLDILAGVKQPTRGAIALGGRSVRFRSPRDAMDEGVRMSFQDETFIPGLSVAENMLFSRYGRRGAHTVISLAKQEREMQRLLDSLGIALLAGQPVSSLNYGSRQMLKVACLLEAEDDARIFLMDEPYRTCSHQDYEHLYATFRRLRDKGFTILFSTHRIEDALAICDSVTILRQDGTGAQFPAASLSYEETVAQLSNRAYERGGYPRLSARSGAPLLTMEHACTSRIDDVSLSLGKGEILGVAGLLGSGRTGIARALCGLDPLLSGSIRFLGESIDRRAPLNRSTNRIGVLLCNRKDLLLLDMDPSSNITVSGLNLVSANQLLNTAEERKVGFDYCRRFNIDIRHFDDPARVLSAGNQQKLLLARLFFSNCRILVLDEPTMNIDVISKNEIYNLMNSYICRGNSIIFISSDLAELKGMTHRIIVMKDRSVAEEITPDRLTYKSLSHK